MDKNLISQYIQLVLFEEKIRSLTLYHGTDIKNLYSVAHNGLDIKKANTGWGQNLKPATFLTPDIEKAARYAIGGAYKHTPVIFEIVLSGHKRFKNVRYDPLDRQEEWYEDNSDLDYLEGLGNNIARGISNVVNFLEKKNPEKESYHFRSYQLLKNLGFPNDYHEPDDLRGFNLYKALINYLINLHDNPRSEIVAAIKREFPAEETIDDNGYLEISENGTLRPTKDWYSSREQLQYFKSVPPAAIKNVYVRLSDHPGINKPYYKEIVSLEPLHLPQEAKGKLEDIQKQFNSWSFDVEKMEKDELSELEDSLKEYEDTEDIIDLVKSGNLAKAKERLRDYSSYEEWGQDLRGKSEEWGKLSVLNAIKLIEKESGIQYKLPFHKKKK